jgi:putative transposase
VQVALTRSGRPCRRNRVARLMRQAGLRARQRRAYRAPTTNSRHADPVAPHTLNRPFWAGGPNETGGGDIPYIRTREGWLDRAVLLDLYSRKVVGGAMDPQMEQALVASAWTRATTRRRPRAGRLQHTDRGSQDAAHADQQRLGAHARAGSMSRTGECYDNAVMGSYFATLKAECVTGVYATRAAARRSICAYIEVWDHRQRRHSALDYGSPEAFEQARVQTTAVSQLSG